MNVRCYLDSTYLKTALQAGISDMDNINIVEYCVREAIEEQFKLVMIRPEFVAIAKEIIMQSNSRVLVGTVIDFPSGDHSLNFKLQEAQSAIAAGADELDFVIDYKSFLKGDLNIVKQQVLECSRLVLQNNRTIKWIIEVAALNATQIIQITTLIKNVIIANFKEDVYDSVFVKSSTGFFTKNDGSIGVATIDDIKLILENAFPLPVKAAGGVRSYEDVVTLLVLGVKRIGTSVAKAIADAAPTNTDY
ncbi:deoxyribose-phosphate aldolase [Flavobacterium chuncheonense]|uniref:Deoxyribose-phosphate aldolase n=1 Tax=Flavobacterium chuncheonense TaxID=2026653 RepID=A0ABW5YN83_9FLAO